MKQINCVCSYLVYCKPLNINEPLGQFKLWNTYTVHKQLHQNVEWKTKQQNIPREGRKNIKLHMKYCTCKKERGNNSPQKTNAVCAQNWRTHSHIYLFFCNNKHSVSRFRIGLHKYNGNIYVACIKTFLFQF